MSLAGLSMTASSSAWMLSSPFIESEATSIDVTESLRISFRSEHPVLHKSASTESRKRILPLIVVFISLQRYIKYKSDKNLIFAQYFQKI